MSKYETMLITSATLDEEATQSVVGKFKDLIEKHGKIEAVDEWGKRRLAYPINKEMDGVYTLIYFESEPDFPAELDRVYKITDGVLRSLIIAREPDAEVPQIKESAPKAAVEAAPAPAPAEPEAKAETDAPQEAKEEEPQTQTAEAATSEEA